MNINPMGQEHWMLAFNAATEDIMGRRLSQDEVTSLGEYLTEAWFQQTPPKKVATKVLAKLLRQSMATIPAEPKAAKAA